MAELLRVIPQAIPPITLGRGTWSRRMTPLSSTQALFVKIGAILPFEPSLPSEEWETLVLRFLAGGIKVSEARALLGKIVPALRLELRTRTLQPHLVQYPFPSRCADLRRILDLALCGNRTDAEPQAGAMIKDGNTVSFLCASLLMLSISLDRQEKADILSRIFDNDICCQQISELAEILIEESRYFTNMCQNNYKQLDDLRKTAEQGLVEVVLPWLLQAGQFSPGSSPTAMRPSGPHFIFEVEGGLS